MKTPETDAAIALANDPDGAPEVCDLCCRLELERNEARKRYDDLLDLYLNRGEMIDDLTSERDAARAELEAWQSEKGPDGWWVKHEEYMEQREQWMNAQAAMKAERDEARQLCATFRASVFPLPQAFIIPFPWEITTHAQQTLPSSNPSNPPASSADAASADTSTHSQ